MTVLRHGNMSKPSAAPPATADARHASLRLLHVVPSYYPAVRYGGPIRAVHALCAALVRAGHQVSVYTTNIDGDGSSDVPLNRPVEMDGVIIHYFPVPALRRLCWAPTLARRLRETIADYDLVHLHSVFLWPTYIAARIARQAGVPYVMAPRGMLVPNVIRAKSRIAKSLWIKWVESKSLAHASCVHVTAEIEGEEARKLGLQLPNIACVPNGVSWPVQHLSLSEGPFADIAKPYALFLSRINHKKGLDRLIRAWKWVPDLKLIIAGNDEENYTSELEALADREGVTDRLQFVGVVRDEHKWSLYENALMFILPSYSENFGNVVAEAMAMACPVVVTPDVGLAELVREVGAGTITSGEPRLLADAVNELRRNEFSRRRCGMAGRRAAAERLSWEGAGLKMANEYRQILGRS
jgi:glycosyltransferase involved in cell wall biosynthesis